MMGFAADLRYAWRALWKAPGLSLAVVVTLGLGCGLNTAIFSVVYGILLRPLALPQPDRLYSVWQNMEARGGKREAATGRGLFCDWRARNRSFQGIAAFMDVPADLGGGDAPENVVADFVSHEYFEVVGVQPVLGRGFAAEEETEGRRHVAVLSHELWARRFGRDPRIVGKPVRLADESYTVVGVLPPGFRAPLTPSAEVWTPLPLSPAPNDRGYSYVYAIARLKSGVGRAAAQADMDRVARALAVEYPKPLDGVGVTLQPVLDAIVGPSRRMLLVLQGAVSLLLLVACVNVGNLLLARAAARRPELALRTALGAGRARLAAQLLGESLLLALGGAAVGLLLGRLGLALLRGLAPAGTPRLDEVRMDGAVWAVTSGVALAAGLLAGLLPAVWIWRRPLSDPLREASGATAGGSARRARGALVVAEIAISLVLLAGAGLLVRTLAALARVDPGFRTARLVLGHLSLSPKRFPSDHELAGFLAQLEERLAADRAIAAAGVISEQPLADGRMDMHFEVEGARTAGDAPTVVVRSVSPGYLGTVGLPMAAGRPVEARDTAATPAVVLVNQRFVQGFLGGAYPLGRRVRLGAPGDKQYLWHTIVGVVGDIRGRALDRPPEAEVYVPVAQLPALTVTVVARAAGAPPDAQRALQRIASQLRPGLVVARAMTLQQSLDRSLAPRRLTAGLLGGFAGVALLLAAVGVYGVVALAVAQRRREFAIRLALGARASEVTAMVLRWSAWLGVAGVAIGLAGALAASRSLASLLYEVQPADPVTLAAVALVLMAVALVASLLPAIRAGRTDLVGDLKSGG